MGLRIGRGREREAAREYRLVGVHCVSCKRVIEEALSSTPGVAAAEVDVASSRLRVVLEDPGAAGRVLEAVRRLGYDVAVDYAFLRLSKGNPGRVAEALRAAPGVVAAEPRWDPPGVTVAYDPEATGIGDLERVVEQAGGRLAEASVERGRPWLPLAASLLAAVALAAARLAGNAALEAAAGAAGGLVGLWVLAPPALRALARGRIISDLLLALGIAASLAASTAGAAAGGPVYWEAAALITLFVLAGRAVEERLRARARRVVEEARRLIPREARVEAGGGVVLVDSWRVEPGSVVIVRAGERVPVDGRVQDGHGEVVEDAVTGESLPRRVSPGDLVYAGSSLASGWLRIVALRAGDYTLVARAAREAVAASPGSWRLQAMADRAASLFTPVVIAVSLAAGAWTLASGGGPVGALVRAATVLVVACPCTFGIAIPAAAAAAVAAASRSGALVRDPDALEALASAGTIALDKTGTLTLGKPRVTAYRVVDGDLPGDPLALAASLESESLHPVARAIVEYYRGEPPRPERVEEIPGFGVIGVVDGVEAAVGGPALARELAGGVPPRLEDYNVFVVVEGMVAAALRVEDQLRPGAAEAVEELKSMGLRVVMVTGDSPERAWRIAREAGIGEVYAGLDPSGKARVIRGLRGGGPVAYAGDGVNDLPALAEADAGIVVDTGVPAAREAGDILLAGGVELLPRLLRLARRAGTVVRLNLLWAFAYNAVLIPVAAGALAPLGIVLEPHHAALAMSMSSVTVTLNSARLAAYTGR